jgi:general secretion pathway protein J
MTRARHHRRHAEKGFTLVELLVALTLLGLISVVLFGGLRFGTRAWEAGDRRAAQLAQVQAVQALLRRRIAQALPPGLGAAAAVEKRAVFAGETDVLQFFAAVPSRTSVGGIYAFDLAAIEDDSGVRLELTWRLRRADDEADDTPEAGLGGRRVLIDGLAAAQFRYFGAPEPGQTADWRDNWDGNAGLPELVAIEAEFPDGGGRAWPVLQVAPKLGETGPAT